MPLALLMPLLDVGVQVAQGLITNDRVNQFVALGAAAAKGVVSAIDAINQMQAWQRSGYTPTNAELDQVLADSAAWHQKIQEA